MTLIVASVVTRGNCSYFFTYFPPSLIFCSLLAQSRPKKANVFGNVDDESPERERAKKKRDLSSKLRPEGAAAAATAAPTDNRKRSAEDSNAVSSKKAKPSQPEGEVVLLIRRVYRKL